MPTFIKSGFWRTAEIGLKRWFNLDRFVETHSSITSLESRVDNLEAVVWDDIRIAVTATTLGGSKNPAFTKIIDNGSSSQGVFTYVFSATQEQELYFAVQLPHSWKEGTDLDAHVHWFPSTNGTGSQKVSWGLEYDWANIGDELGNTSIVYGNVTHIDETLVAKKHYMTEIHDISGTGMKISSMLMCRVFRDATGVGATDDFGGTAALLEFDFHYQVDSRGSSQEYVK